MTNIAPFPRAVRPAPSPLGLYFRAGRNDHRVLSELIAAGDAACTGIVVDATHADRHKELRAQAVEHRIHVILDPKTMEMATPGGFTQAQDKLPWGTGEQHRADDFRGQAGERLISTLGDFAVEGGFTQVLAPTHLIESVDDGWLDIDTQSVRQLKAHLDRETGGAVSIVYPLVLPYSVLRDGAQRRAVIEALRSVDVDAIWLRVGGISASAGSPAAVKAYIAAAAEFHALGIPVVADQIGGLFGLSLLAFGAVGGISHGITMGERFDHGRYRRPSNGNPFTPSRKVYVPALDLMLKPTLAEELVRSSPRNKGMFGCRDKHCCPRGVDDMLGNPARHFMVQRINEVAGLSQIPESLRPQRFLDRHLRPATDAAVAAAAVPWSDESMCEKTEKHRKRLDALRITLGNQAAKHPPVSFAKHPKTLAMTG